MSSGVPPEIPGLGSSSMVLRVSPGFDPLKAQIGPDEYFVLSRVDGTQTVRQILLSTGLPVERGVAIIARLRALGALLFPGETVAPAAVVPPPAAARAKAPASADAPVLPEPTPEELAALAESSEIPGAERRRILALERLIRSGSRDPHALLGVARGTDATTLKRSYFKLSKEIHPDRYYGKQLGSFKDRLPAVFDAVSRAYAQLTAPAPRKAALGRSSEGTEAETPQTPQEYAAELFDRARELEVGGDPLEAMKLFAAAVRVDPQTRYLRRAASCALAAGQPKTAVEYAKKAQANTPDDPSSARLLASAFRAAGKLGDAEEVLVLAMAMKSENDVLTGELRHDLAEVRRLLASG